MVASAVNRFDPLVELAPAAEVLGQVEAMVRGVHDDALATVGDLGTVIVVTNGLNNNEILKKSLLKHHNSYNL